MDYNTTQQPLMVPTPTLLPGASKGKFLNLFDPKERELAAKILDYYDGNQHEYVERVLKKIRKSSMQEGMMARHRNILRTIVDKSAMLFNGKPPKLFVTLDNEDLSDATEVEVEDSKLSNVANKFFESANWIEFFTNFDSLLRMLKTAIVLVYWVPTKETIKLIALSRHNCAVHFDQDTDEFETLIYSTGQIKDDGDNILDTYRIFTSQVIQDIVVDKNGEERILSITENPYGFIPAVVFHDTNIPREGFWNKIPSDLLSLNEMYNIAISDSEFSASWNKVRTVVTNAKIRADDTNPDFVEQQMYLNPLIRRVPSGGPASIGGPGRILELDTSSLGGGQVFFEYKGPDADLEPLDNIIKNWVIDYAADWSVNVSTAGNGSADSGFKLVVQELPNLELRKKRQKMQEIGIERLFNVMKNVVNTWKPNTFPSNAELEVAFSLPELPVDEKQSEETWSLKIKDGRASIIDYLMEVKGMTREEAEQKLSEIQAYNSGSFAPLKQEVVANEAEDDDEVQTSEDLEDVDLETDDQQNPESNFVQASPQS